LLVIIKDSPIAILSGIEGMYKISTEKVSGINPLEGINLDTTLASKLVSQFRERGTELILNATKLLAHEMVRCICLPSHQESSQHTYEYLMHSSFIIAAKKHVKGNFMVFNAFI
jgi:hypothetical protein